MRNVSCVYLQVGVEWKCWWVAVYFLLLITDTLPKPTLLLPLVEGKNNNTVTKEEALGKIT